MLKKICLDPPAGFRERGGIAYDEISGAAPKLKRNEHRYQPI